MYDINKIIHNWTYNANYKLTKKKNKFLEEITFILFTFKKMKKKKTAKSFTFNQFLRANLFVPNILPIFSSYYY